MVRAILWKGEAVPCIIQNLGPISCSKIRNSNCLQPLATLVEVLQVLPSEASVDKVFHDM